MGPKVHFESILPGMRWLHCGDWIILPGRQTWQQVVKFLPNSCDPTVWNGKMWLGKIQTTCYNILPPRQNCPAPAVLAVIARPISHFQHSRPNQVSWSSSPRPGQLTSSRSWTSPHLTPYSFLFVMNPAYRIWCGNNTLVLHIGDLFVHLNEGNEGCKHEGNKYGMEAAAQSSILSVSRQIILFEF